MESNLTKILIKKFWERCVSPPPLGYLTKRYDPPLFWQSLSPSPVRPQAPSPPLKKTSLPLDPINAVKKLKILNFNIKQAKFYF